MPLLRKNKQGIVKDTFRKISYSQCGEDLIVKFLFDALGIMRPTYLDIGAHHPFEINNTALFYESGSTGINIEPNPDLIKNFLALRPNDLNLNIGISGKAGEMDYYMMNFATLNTFSKESAENSIREGGYKIDKVIKVKTETVGDIITQYAQGNFPEFLNIDAEGVEDIIVRSINFNTNFPLVICMETISFSENGRGKKNIQLIDYLVGHGYINYADTYINNIFIRKDRWVR
jgi:FkbM family methyltransferase